MPEGSLIEVVDITNGSASSAGGGSNGSLAGIELLMNDRAKTPTSSGGGGSSGQTSGSDVIKSLERDLESLGDSKSGGASAGPASGPSPGITSISIEPVGEKPSAPAPLSAPSSPVTVAAEPIKIELGSKAAGAVRGGSTWDGFKSTTEPVANVAAPTLSKQDMLKEKFGYLRKLEALERKGQRLTKNYTMESSLDEMKGEYEMIVSEKEKEASVRFQAKMLMACVTGITFLNQRFDPFDVSLEGWDETVQENVRDYDDVFAELHEKYRSKAKIAPELKLLFMLGGSAVMAHMSNTMFKSAVPGVDDLLRENPELMRQFTQAAATSMTAEKPGLASFLGEFAPPPPPSSQPGPRSGAGTAAGRPDLDIRNLGEEGFDVSTTEAPVHNRTPRVRPDMSGPRDIGDIIARLKPKGGAAVDNSDGASRISVDDATANSGKSARQPSKSKRRTGGSERSINLVM